MNLFLYHIEKKMKLFDHTILICSVFSGQLSIFIVKQGAYSLLKLSLEYGGTVKSNSVF